MTTSGILIERTIGRLTDIFTDGFADFSIDLLKDIERVCGRRVADLVTWGTPKKVES